MVGVRHPVELLARDIATASVRNFVRQVVREVLSKLVFLTLRPPSKPKRSPSLRLVEK